MRNTGKKQSKALMIVGYYSFIEKMLNESGVNLDEVQLWRKNNMHLVDEFWKSIHIEKATIKTILKLEESIKKSNIIEPSMTKLNHRRSLLDDADDRYIDQHS